MMFRTKIQTAVLLWLFAASVSHGFNTVYVDVNGPNEPGSGTVKDPFRRIQNALDAAADSDIVEILPGVYTGTGNYNLDPYGNNIVVRSTGPEDLDIVRSTIIDPNKAGRGFYFQSGEDANCVLSGLTIRNGSTLSNGGGILCEDSSPTINNCIITANQAGLYGGGIFCDWSSPEIKRCIITGNSAQDGGGVGCWWYANPRLSNCIITGNEASDIGGGGAGLECVLCDNVSVTNCTLAGNFTAGSGGGIRCEDSEVTVTNCVFRANSAANGPQIALVWFASNPAVLSVSFSNVQGSKQAVYADPCSTLHWDDGNIDTDPCFVSFDAGGNCELWDLHLQSAYGRWDSNSQSWVADSNTSLCIDGGEPDLDVQDEPWPNGKRVNMGAYGGTNQASMNGNPADFDISGDVDFADFAEFSYSWSCTEPCIYDLNLDGVVNYHDLRELTENWLYR